MKETIPEFKCECYSGSTITEPQFYSGSVFIDTYNGEIVCTSCGLVSTNYCWTNGEIYEK